MGKSDIEVTFLHSILTSDKNTVWENISNRIWEIMSQGLPETNYDLEISHRDRLVGQYDAALLSSWELWNCFPESVEKGSSRIINFWKNEINGKALLVLDALSLRESPWILEGARKRGYKIEFSGPVSSELPSETTEFAKAIGFSQRSALTQTQTNSSHVLANTKTVSCDLPWEDCIPLVESEENFIFWHHWPDSRMHDLSEPGDGFQTLVKEAKSNLDSNEFWDFIERLTTGRKLIITSDHGYAASSLFYDVTDKEQAVYLKENFKSGRSLKGGKVSDNWAPPLEVELEGSNNSSFSFVLGRRKWKSAGGYPTLLHGGLTLLEVLTPFIVISR